jgi:DNA-directed RNA polymerase subunit RPC12/RpoP
MGLRRNDMNDDNVTCPHCEYECNIGSLIGPRTNDCPRCGYAVLGAKKPAHPLAMSDTHRLELAAYIADYINEEKARGNTDVTPWMVEAAIEAFEGGAR